MDIPLDEVLHFDAITTHPSTGAATDADSTPTFAVYEEATDTDIGIGGNLTKRTSLTGNYRGTFTASAANGFEVGKWYSIIGSATVNSIAGKAVLRNFRIVGAEYTAGYPVITVKDGTGTGEINTNVQSECADALAAYSASTLTAAQVWALADGIETGVTPKQAVQRIGATTAGKISGAGTGTEVFLGLDGLTTRVTVTVDGSGNRSSVVYA